MYTMRTTDTRRTLVGRAWEWQAVRQQLRRPGSTLDKIIAKQIDGADEEEAVAINLGIDDANVVLYSLMPS